MDSKITIRIANMDPDYGCQTMKPIHTVQAVDLKRFMGDWYVIASIPTFIEKDAYNAIESYRLDQDGTVATTFRFNKGSFDGPLKEYTPRGFIQDKTLNAVWGMQFIWPFKAEYRVIYLKTITPKRSLAAPKGIMSGSWLAIHRCRMKTMSKF